MAEGRGGSGSENGGLLYCAKLCHRDSVSVKASERAKERARAKEKAGAKERKSESERKSKSERKKERASE